MEMTTPRVSLLNFGALSHRFKFSAPVQVCRVEQIDPKTYVYVIGDPDNATYEWAIVDGAGMVTAHSDNGYGESARALRAGLRALRAGLIEALGMPSC